MMNANKIIRLIIIILISIFFVYLFINYKDYLNWKMKVSIMVLYLLFVFALFFKKDGLIAVIYFVFLFVILFVRDKVNTNLSGNNYLEKWIKLIFKNKIVFVNVIGNIVLFMPLAWIILNFMKKKSMRRFNNLLCLLSCFILIASVEIIQLITSLGVFDYIDIILNMIGVVLTILIYEFFEEIIYGKTKERQEKEKTRT